MDKIDLAAQLRPEGISPNALRQQGLIPVVMYGKGEEPISLAVTLNDFQKVYKAAGETTIINLHVADGVPKMVLIKDLQVSPDKGDYLHIDFYRIKAGEKLHVTVPLKFEHEAPAVKDFGGILVTNKNEVEVECLPQDLPHEILVDLSKLIAIDDAIFVKDLIINPGVEVLDHPEESIIVVTPPAVEEVEPVVSEAEAVAAVETTGEKPETAPEENAKEENPES